MTLRTFCGNLNNLKLRYFLSPVCKNSSHQRLGFRYVKTKTTPKKPLTTKIREKLFGRYLLTTNIVSSGILMVIGDAMAQEIEYQKKLSTVRCDLKRIGQMFIVGALQGPLHHFFYKWIDTIMPIVSMSSVIKKILLDQVLMSPACILLFFYSAGYLENKGIDACNDEVKSKFLTVYVVDWTVWPLAQFFNFYWLHPKYRVIYVNVVTMLYNIFLSYIKHGDNLKN